MMQSWIIYNVSTGKILCYGREIDVVSDQAKIDAGDLSCALHAIQTMCCDPEVEVLYGAPGDIDPLSLNLLEVDHGTQQIVSMPLVDVKLAIRETANKDILASFSSMHILKACISNVYQTVPTWEAIRNSITAWVADLSDARDTIDSQINGLSTDIEAISYYNDRAWLSEFPAPIEWEGI
jgi:hypothetical protein